MQKVMNGITQWVKQPTRYGLQQWEKFTGESVSALTRAAAPHFAGRGLVLLAASGVALSCFVPCPMVAMAVGPVAVYAGVDFVRVMRRYEKAENDWGNGQQGALQFKASMNPTVRAVAKKTKRAVRETDEAVDRTVEKTSLWLGKLFCR